MAWLGFLFGKGKNGFGYTSTAEQVTEGQDLHGKTYLVTGANSGLGAETARVLALRGATVVAAARTAAKAEEAARAWSRPAIPLACELSDPASVRAAVAEVKRQGLHLDGIIANAGIMALPQRQVAFGYELQFFTNHVGHFLLVTGLLGQLTPTGRVVMLSSRAHENAPREGIRLDDLGAEKHYSAWTHYGQSKLANLLFARELARRLPAGQTANSVHPGVIATNLGRHLPGVAELAMHSVGKLTMKTIPQGAATQTCVAVHPQGGQVTGEYWADCNPARSSRQGQDDALARALWDKSEEIVRGLP